jgi:hypothetical protein
LLCRVTMVGRISLVAGRSALPDPVPEPDSVRS